VEDIVTICQGHDKTHLIGANSLKEENAQHSVTFHHDWFMNVWDRLPRLRAGNVHNYNIYVDDVDGLAAKRLRDARAAAMSSTDRSKLNSTYNFNPFLNGSISTEGGAILVEKSFYRDCLTPLRNNQTDPSNPVYTGKILALDTIYQMDETVIRGDSTDPGNPLGPFQAPVIPFSWNLPGNELPYSYTMDDPDELPEILAAGAGAGTLNWDRTNWLMTSYPPVSKSGFSEWQSLNFSPEQQEDPAVSGPDATPAHDGVANLVKYALGLSPFDVATQPLVECGFTNGTFVLRYHKPAAINDVVYEVDAATALQNWSSANVIQQFLSTDENGLQTWQASFANAVETNLFLRLLLIH
jgi:hypothetical protein